MKEAVIVSGVRTPLGAFSGSLGNIPATKLGAIVIEESVKRAGIDKEMVKLALLFNNEDSQVNSLVGDYFKAHGNLAKAADYYQKSIQFNFFNKEKVYNNLLEIYEKVDGEEDRESLLEFLSQKITNPERFPLFLNIILAKNSYLVGKDYLEKGEEEKTLYWWGKAKRVLPEWSYFHLEVASLYQQLEEEKKTKEVLLTTKNFKVKCRITN